MAKQTNATNTTGTAAQSYRVLARKYRPATFDDLIGQSAMVRCLRGDQGSVGSVKWPAARFG